MNGALFQLFPRQDRSRDLAVLWSWLQGCAEYDSSCIKLDIPNLVRTRPDLIPGNIDVMCYGLPVEAIRSSVGNHRRE